MATLEKSWVFRIFTPPYPPVRDAMVSICGEVLDNMQSSSLYLVSNFVSFSSRIVTKMTRVHLFIAISVFYKIRTTIFSVSY